MTGISDQDSLKLTYEKAVEYRISQPDLALSLLDEIIAVVQPKLEAACRLLKGRILTYLDRPEEALPDLERSMILSPQCLQASRAYWVALLQLGRFDKAIDEGSRFVKSIKKQEQTPEELAEYVESIEALPLLSADGRDKYLFQIFVGERLENS